MAALRAQAPDLRFSALGGGTLAEAGVEIVQSAADIGVMGFTEVIGALPALLAARRRVWSHLASAEIDLCVPIDFPGFNLKLAGKARRHGIPVFYLIPPQMWAWGAWRLNGFAATVDRVGTILPFEADFYRRRGLDVFAMGHPLMEDYGPFPFDACRRERELRLSDPQHSLTIGIFPGSRRQEIERLLPVLKITAHMIQSWLQIRRVDFVVSVAPGADGARMRELISGDMQLSDEPLPQLCRRMDLAIVCSGTASLEAALAGVPHEIVYRTSPLSYWIARRLTTVDYCGLPNLILGKEAVPEHLQSKVAPVPLAHSLLKWISRPASRLAFYDDVRRLRGQLGEPGVWQRTAEAVLAFLDRSRVDETRRTER